MPELESLPEEVQARLEAQRITDDVALSTYLNLSQSAVEAAERFRTDFDVAWGDAARVVAALHKPGEYGDISAKVKTAVEEELQPLHPLLRIAYNVLQYESAASSGGRPSKAFKLKLIQKYLGHTGSNIPSNLTCLMTGLVLPSNIVIAAHLLKSEWARLKAHSDLFNFSDIDDEHNGLLLFKPFEWAFDRGLLMFVEVDVDPQGLSMFEMRLLQPSIADVKLIAKLREIDSTYAGSVYFAAVESAVGQLTFGNFHKKKLCFYTACRPFKRVLYFHAKMCAAKAVRNKWLLADDEVLKFEEFCSPFQGLKAVQDWLATADFELSSDDE